ncbi:MAG: ABC transporter permease [Candidatus Aminicenantes bacterium]|nr:MAG: ABC transporter permease [Candidatus Aminicenantes bacterium]
MFKNYLIITLRNIKRHKAYSLINILGLAIGMALCILILVYVQDELSYDNFHEKGDRIYRIAELEDHDGELLHYMRIGPGVTEKLKIDFPNAVENTVRLLPAGDVWTKFEDKLFQEDHVYVVDETFFNIFSFEFISGDKEAALKEPNSLVLNKTTAEKYFGITEVAGKMVQVDIPGVPLLKVTAVVKDIPSNSHFHPDLLISLSTIRNEQNQAFFDERMYGNTVWSYILFKEGYAAGELESQLPAFLEKHLNEAEKKRVKEFYLQPLKNIHLRSSTDPFTEIEPENTGNITYIYIFSIIAFLILLVACINFMNLATARSANRAQEVGIRKVVGAPKKQLIRQFMGESLFLTFIALPLALGIAHLFLPLFNSLAGKEMTISYFNNLILLPALVLIVLFVGFVSGSYPAFFLSSFQPVNVLKGKQIASGGSSPLRKILVVGQFAVSIGFVIGVLIVLQQLNFMRNSDLGFNKENVVVVPAVLPEPALQRARKVEVLKNEYLRHPGVIEVTAAQRVPSDIRGIVNCRVEGASMDEAKIVAQVATDYEFLKTLEIELIEGRNFSREHSTDMREGFIINEAAVKNLGLESPIGKRIVLANRKGTVIGVFKSPHWEPKRRFIAPMVFFMRPMNYIKLAVKISPKDIPGTLAFLEKKWDENITTRPFQYEFLEDMYDSLYKSERQMTSVVFYFTLLTIFIACLGLFGLASFATEQRTKEIGIRKILGASVPGVVMLLWQQFGKLVLIGNIIAIPLAYYVLHRWLQNFHYRISIGVEVFLLSTVMIVAIAVLSISYQSIKAAVANPVDSLRYE